MLISFLVSRNNICLYTLIGEAFVFQTLLKKNMQRFWYWRDTQLNLEDRYSIMPMSALIGSNVLLNFIILPVLKSKVESLFSVSKIRFVGRELVLTIVLYCLLKKSLNKFAFAKKSVTKVNYQLIAAVLGEF